MTLIVSFSILLISSIILTKNYYQFEGINYYTSNNNKLSATGLLIYNKDKFLFTVNGIICNDEKFCNNIKFEKASISLEINNTSLLSYNYTDDKDNKYLVDILSNFKLNFEGSKKDINIFYKNGSLKDITLRLNYTLENNEIFDITINLNANK